MRRTLRLTAVLSILALTSLSVSMPAKAVKVFPCTAICCTGLGSPSTACTDPTLGTTSCGTWGQHTACP